MKNTINIIAGIMVTVIICFFIYKLFHQPIKMENNLGQLIELNKKSSIQYVDRTGKTHTVIEQVFIKDKQASLLYREKIDSLAKLLDVKDKQIVGLISLSGKAEYKFTPDTSTSTLQYHSKWFDLSVDSLKIYRATFRDSFNLVFIKRPYGFLNLKEKVEVNTFSSNPNMKYSNVKSWYIPEIKNNRAKFGLGITTGYGVQFGNSSITYGPQITAGLQIRF